MYIEACISLIDTFFEWEGCQNLFESSPGMLETITRILVRSLPLITGRSSITIYNAISKIFEMPSAETLPLVQIWKYIINCLNQMW